MIGIIKKDRKEQEAKNQNTNNGPQVTPGQLRVNADLADLEKDLPNNAKLVWPEKTNLMKMELTCNPAPESYWAGGKYMFTIEVGADYPFAPPKVMCLTKIYHPNIDPQGNVCLNILREDWKPVLNLNNIILGILFLFIDPNPNDPLNEDAASLMRSDLKQFQDTVRRTMKGGSVKGENYPKLI